MSGATTLLSASTVGASSVRRVRARRSSRRAGSDCAGAAADAAFRAWIEALWPEAEAAGVSRADLRYGLSRARAGSHNPRSRYCPARAERRQPRPGRVHEPAVANISTRPTSTRLAADGKALLAKHKAALEKIEREIGVDRYSVLAHLGPRDGVRRTQAPARCDPRDGDAGLPRPAQGALPQRAARPLCRMLEAGVARADMRSSWAGAVGLTQFMPSEYFTHAHDLDGDGVDRYLQLRPRCARLRRAPAQGQGLGARARPGATRCA